MKNIHVLSTDKSSRLSIKDGVVILHRLQWRKGTQHIYITSDEEIKEGYFLDLTHNIVMKAVFYPSSDKNCKKIILTTDQDLINDGVQAIDNVFLEWFVKNPSCEWVEVKSWIIDKEWDETYKQFNPIYPQKTKYKIIIPKEEPYERTIQSISLSEVDKEEPKKIFDLPIATNLGNALTGTMKSVSQHEAIIIPKEEPKLTNTINRNELGIPKGTLTELIGVPKQETLEEVAFRLYPRLINDPYNPSEDDNKEEREIWIRGAKWQSERMYSEEEVIELLIKFNQEIQEVEDIRIWFEQFKKK